MMTTSMKKPARAAVVLCLALYGTTAQAAVFDTPPVPSAPRPLQIAAPREQTLANGLRVVVAERRGLPVTTAQLMVLSGNEVDPVDHAGLAAMTASLLTKGSRHRDASRIASAAETLGGTLESVADWDRSSVSMTVTTPKLDAALGLIAEVVTEPVFKQPELDQLRAQTVDELQVAYARPGVLASLAATRMLFGSGTYGNPARGTPTSLKRIGRGDVQKLYRDYYRPDNAVLIVAGDTDLEAAVALAQKHFGRWSAPSTPLPATAPSKGRMSDQAMTVIDMGKSGQAGVVLALPLQVGSVDDQAIGDVINTVLGDGFSSRLNQEIRIKRGLSYGARSRLDERRDGGLLRASVQTKNESAAEVVGLVKAEFDRITDTPVGADELAARKATLIGVFSRSVETTDGLTNQVGTLVSRGRSPAELPQLIGRLSAVTAVQVQQYAKDHFGAGQRRIAVAGDASQFETELKKTVPDLRSVRQDQLDLDR